VPNNLLFIYSAVNFSVAHSHNLCKISELPRSAAMCQAALQSLSVTNNNLLFISSVVRFSLAHSLTFCKISELPRSAAMCQAVLPSLSVPN